jgi:hypothetical protein
MTRVRSVVGFLASLAVIIALPGVLTAQSQATTGIIRGVVTDQTGSPVGGATVVLRETETNFERTITASTSGIFVAPLLPLGTYEVTVRAVGMQEARRTGLPLRVGETLDLRFSLQQAVALEAITVSGDAPVVDPTRSEAATRLPEEAAKGLPNNGRNFLDLTTLTPNVAIVQGPDGDELTVAGQRGIHNNVSVDGADFNNPFFGEQRGGQRPPFTFNLDAVREIVVISDGANAEFGRSGGGFVNVITKSGTNEVHGSVHYFGKFDALSATAEHSCAEPGGLCSAAGELLTRDPDFTQNQFGFTLGGPIARDRAFFFVAYDQQVLEDTRQKAQNRVGDPALRAWVDTAFGGALLGDDGPIDRTDNARALLAKFDIRLSDRHNASLKYNYTWSQQENGTFDVDTWLRSANGLEKDFSHAINGSLSSVLSSRVTNEFRFQWGREDRPRPYLGATIPGVAPPPGVDTGNRPFPDIAIGPNFRLGMPFFLPVEYYDTRIQILDNVTLAAGNHLFKFGGEWNRVESVQTFIGFANGRFIFSSVDGFLNYVEFGNQYVECFDAAGNFVTSSTTATCPAGSSIGGPVLLYLQQAGVGGITVEEAGTQSIPQHEVALFVQDSWKPHRNLTLNLGVRWEASIQPDVITPPDEVFYAPFIGQTSMGQMFPSDGTIPSDWDNVQPRFGFAWDVEGDSRTVLRGSAGLYYARVPGLNLASTRSTNGSRGQTLFRNSALTDVLGPPPNIDDLLPQPVGTPFLPDVFVFDRDFENPRTFAATFGIERELVEGYGAGLTFTHSRTDHLTRFINRNDAAFGSPWSTGLEPGGANGINTLTVVESSAKSRYNGVTVSLQRNLAPVQFQVNYTLSFDKSDDDNERDPFTFRYAVANNLTPEYNWSDRDQRHRFNAWLLATLPGDILFNNRLSAYSAQPASESCGPRPGNPFAPPAGARAVTPQDRICEDGSILKRNTLRKDNAYFSWDIRISKLFRTRGAGAYELIFEMFNVTNSDNFLDPSIGGLLFNFDGTLTSGLGAPRQAQVGFRWLF